MQHWCWDGLRAGERVTTDLLLFRLFLTWTSRFCCCCTYYLTALPAYHNHWVSSCRPCPICHQTSRGDCVSFSEAHGYTLGELNYQEKDVDWVQEPVRKQTGMRERDVTEALGLLVRVLRRRWRLGADGADETHPVRPRSFVPPVHAQVESRRIRKSKSITGKRRAAQQEDTRQARTA